VGDGAPITVQTMEPIRSTWPTPRRRLPRSAGAREAGVDIIRVSCPDEEVHGRRSSKIVKGGAACRSWPTSTSTISAANRGRRLAGAACLRINPRQYRQAPIGCAPRVVKAAVDHGPCRCGIGVNAGSPREGPAREIRRRPCPGGDGRKARLDHARQSCRTMIFHNFKISVKAFGRLPGGRGLPAACRWPATTRSMFGVTEAGGMRTGTVEVLRSGMGSLLWAGQSARHDPASRCRPRPEEEVRRRLRDAEGAEPAPSRRQT